MILAEVSLSVNKNIGRMSLAATFSVILYQTNYRHCSFTWNTHLPRSAELNDIPQYICTMSQMAFLNINLRHNDVVIRYLSSLFACAEHAQTLTDCSRVGLISKRFNKLFPKSRCCLPSFTVDDFVEFL